MYYGLALDLSPAQRTEVDDGTSLPKRCPFTRDLKRSGLFNLGNTDAGKEIHSLAVQGTKKEASKRFVRICRISTNTYLSIKN